MKKMLYLKIALFLLLCIVLFIGWMYVTNHRFRVEYYTVASKRIPKNFDESKMILITDLHNHSFGRKNSRLLKAIENENPDYVMVAGDLLIKKKPFATEAALNLLEKLALKYPVYYVPGNHEKRLGEMKETKNDFWNGYIAKIKKMGVTYLLNETITLKKGNQKIYLSGADIDRIYYKKGFYRPKLKKEELDKILPIDESEQGYRVLLAHNPEYFETYAAWGADLVLSGHFHGGIMILPLIGGVIAPSYRLFPKYDCGKFQNGESTMILSRGLAVHSIKIRIFNIPELSLITLKKDNNS